MRKTALFIAIDKLNAFSNLDRNLSFNDINKDTRTIKPDDVYVAIKGEQFDGHSFIKNALEKRASFIISEKQLDANIPHLVCENSIVFLQQWAKEYRKLHRAVFLGITGSNGKTTTKELLYSVLSSAYKTYRTPGNYNNDIGVPLTLLNMPEDTEFAIVEMGTNHPGEIGFLADIVKPHHSVITNIGFSHMEHFKDIHELVAEKCSLFDHTDKKGTLFINQDDPYLVNYFSDQNKHFFGEEKGETAYRFLSMKNGQMHAIVGGIDFSLKVLGRHLLSNVSIAVAFGQFFNLNSQMIKESLQQFEPVSGRMQWLECGNYSVIHDAYNANPNSMLAALSFFEELESDTPKIAVLGDMLELGDASSEKHSEVLSKASKYRYSDVLLYGAEMKHAQSDGFKHFESHKEIAAYITLNYPSAVLLLKGSRGMRLEQILPYL